jgi:quercetin dioxygenase-like cupin family protein
MSVIHRFCGNENAFDWEDVKSKQYPDGAAKGASGKILIGNAEGAEHFVFRYFCIAPGGYSTLQDHHAHDHGVMILHGHAQVSIEDEQYELKPRDIIYISPWEQHSLAAIGDQPMGFLCVIPNKTMLAGLKGSENK